MIYVSQDRDRDDDDGRKPAQCTDSQWHETKAGGITALWHHGGFLVRSDYEEGGLRR